MRIIGCIVAVLGIAILYYCYFKFPAHGVKAEEIMAMRFWTVVGWVMLPVGIGMTAFSFIRR
jgi:hypothetical protein